MQITINKWVLFRLLGLVISVAAFVPHLAVGAVNATTAPLPDNSATNVRDTDPASPTADRASNEAVDRQLMKEIRKSVTEDQTLSTYAKNVKIISQNGKVTLRGPVSSDQEKEMVVSKATAIAGNGNVTDDLSVSSNP